MSHIYKQYLKVYLLLSLSTQLQFGTSLHFNIICYLVFTQPEGNNLSWSEDKQRPPSVLYGLKKEITLACLMNIYMHTCIKTYNIVIIHYEYIVQ